MDREEYSLYEMTLDQVLSQRGSEVHRAILWDGMCGLVCPECPLRPWKSGLSRTYCLDVLEAIKRAQKGRQATGAINQDGVDMHYR